MSDLTLHAVEVVAGAEPRTGATVTHTYGWRDPLAAQAWADRVRALSLAPLPAEFPAPHAAAEDDP